MARDSALGAWTEIQDLSSCPGQARQAPRELLENSTRRAGGLMGLECLECRPQAIRKAVEKRRTVDP